MIEAVDISNADGRDVEFRKVMGSSGEMDNFKHSVDELFMKVDKLEQRVNDVEQFYLSTKVNQPKTSPSPGAMKDKDKERHAPSFKKLQQDASRREAGAVKRMQDLMRQFGSILRQITQHKCAWPFMQPVDVEGLGLDDYYEVIDRPMDFSTIKNQMEAKDGTGYRHVRDICADVRLIFQNAMKYNEEKSNVHRMAKTLLAKFEEKWLQLLPKVIEEEKRREDEEAEGRSNMQLAHAKIARDLSNEIADQGDHSISRSSHKKTGKSGKQPSSSRRLQDTLGFAQLPPIVSIPPLRDQEEEIVAESTSSSSGEIIVRHIPPTVESGSSHQLPHTQQSHPSTSGGHQEQPQQLHQQQQQQHESDHQSGHQRSHPSGEQQSQTNTIQTAPRLLIRPDGNGFDPHKKPVEAIANAIKENPGEGYPNWKKVPNHIRRLWFEAFQRQFQWSETDEGRIRKNFDLRGANRYRSIMASVRGAKRQPFWMGDDVYAALCRHWQSDQFRVKSEQAKKNRDVNAGASLHTGGATPHRVVYRNLMDNEGNPPSVDTFYEATHKIRKGDKAGTWVSQQAQETYDSFARRRDNVGSSRPDEGYSQPSQPPPSDLVIFSNAVGGKKKGRISGLGSLASTIGDAGFVVQLGSAASASSSRLESSRVTDARLAELEAQLAQMRDMVRGLTDHIRAISGENERITPSDGGGGGGDPEGDRRGDSGAS